MNELAWLKAAVLALSPIVESRTGHDVSEVPVHWHSEQHPLGANVCGFTDYRGIHFYPCRADNADGIDPSVSRLGVVVHEIAHVIEWREHRSHEPYHGPQFVAIVEKLDLTPLWAGWFDLQSRAGRSHPRWAPQWAEPIIEGLGPWNISS